MADVTTSAASDSGPSRRSILARVWIGLCGVAVLEIGWVLSTFFRPRATATRGDEEAAVVVAGPVDRFAPGSVTPFPHGRFYLVRLDDGGFLALSRTCTHLGCTVPWDDAEGRFVCPCHGSSFDLKGAVVGPPAPRPLDLHPVRIENDVVKVDTGRTITRRAFEPGQPVRA
jgi:cytochrome b6-f complex iron-sulfur subunit